MNINHNIASNISALRNTTRLEELHIWENGIVDITPIASISTLIKLSASFNNISDIGALTSMNQLEDLDLYENDLSDISPLSGKYEIRHLNLRYNNVSDISALAGMTKLTHLNLEDNNISDIRVLSNMYDMTLLYLGGNQIDDIAVLKGLIHLRNLTIWGNHIEDIEAIKGMSDLTWLAVSWNNIADISILSNLAKLENCDIRGNHIDDLSPIQGLSNLSILWAKSNNISDISAILTLPSISDCDLTINPLNTEAYRTVIPALELNPNLVLSYDPPAWRTLELSSTVGGTVIDPNEGIFQYILGEEILIEAASDNPAYRFSTWSGTIGNVQDPRSAATYVTLNSDTSLKAEFVSFIGLYVDDNAPADPGPGDPNVSDPAEDGSQAHPFDSIQEAMDAINPGGNILVLDGTYTGPGNEQIDPKGKAVTLKSYHGVQACVLQGSLPFFYIHSGEGQDTVIQGLGLMGDTQSVAVQVEADSAPIFQDCSIQGIVQTDNTSEVHLTGSVDITANQIPGVYVLDSGTHLTLMGGELTGTILGLGTVTIPAGQTLSVAESGLIYLGKTIMGRFEQIVPGGYLDCQGHMEVAGDIQYSHISLLPHSRFVLFSGAMVEHNIIHVTNAHYVDHANFSGSFLDNQITLTLDDSQSSRVLELYAQDLEGLPSGATQLLSFPATQDQANWALDTLELTTDTALSLIKGGEALYVRKLVLGPFTEINIGQKHLYYETLTQHATAKVVNNGVLGYSLGNIGFDDVNEFNNRIITNEQEAPSAVQPVFGGEPDPTGMMRMRAEPQVNTIAQAQFDGTTAQSILVKFQYLFEVDNVELWVYLSDTTTLSNPNRLFVGHVTPPKPSLPGSLGIERMAQFERSIAIDTLNLNQGTFLEFELRNLTGQIINAMILKGNRFQSMGDPTDGGLLIDEPSCQVHCDGICLDLTYDDLTDESDFVTVIANMGRTSELSQTKSLYCLDLSLSKDGYVDTLDIGSWDWALNYNDGSFCDEGTPMVKVTTQQTVFSEAKPNSTFAPAAELSSGLLVLGKNNTSVLTDALYPLGADLSFDHKLSLDATSGYIRIIQDDSKHIYLLHGNDGITSIDTSTEVLLSRRYTFDSEPRYNQRADVFVGIERSIGRPIRDAIFTENALYIAPVVVKVENKPAYLAVAKLNKEGAAYQLETLFSDATYTSDQDNPNLDGLREIEIDSSGIIYTLNSHRLNESDRLTRYLLNGRTQRWAQDTRILGKPGSNEFIPDPTCLTLMENSIILASGQLHSKTSPYCYVYQLHKTTMALKNKIKVNNMHLVTGIANDTTNNRLWVVGVQYDYNQIQKNDDGTPGSPAPGMDMFYKACYAEIPVAKFSEIDPAVDAKLLDAGDLALPTGVLWMD